MLLSWQSNRFHFWVSRARMGDMVLNGVWLRKNIVQSSSCVSAPSGSIDIARTLGYGRLSAQGGLESGTYPSSIPSGWGNWYLSWAPSKMWNSASRTKEQWFPWPAMIMEEGRAHHQRLCHQIRYTPSCDPYRPINVQLEGFPLFTLEISISLSSSQ